MGFLNTIPGAVAQGLIWGLMAIGVYISYKVLDIADLTVDGTIATGACVCAVLITNGVPAWIAIVVSFLAGIIAGIVTGLLHTVFDIPAILSGILTQLILFSVNLKILSGKSMLSIDPRANKLILNQLNNVMAIVAAGAIITGLIILLWRFFYTEIGLTLKSTGDNPDMSRAQGVNVELNKVIGLAISNGIVALAGALLAQYQGFADVNIGRGAIVIGLAAIFIGLSVSLKIKPNFVVSLIGVVGGGIMYYLVYTFVIFLGLDTDLLKMLSAVIVALFLAVPYVKRKYFTKQVEQDDDDTEELEVKEGA